MSMVLLDAEHVILREKIFQLIEIEVRKESLPWTERTLVGEKVVPPPRLLIEGVVWELHSVSTATAGGDERGRKIKR